MKGPSSDSASAIAAPSPLPRPPPAIAGPLPLTDLLLNDLRPRVKVSAERWRANQALERGQPRSAELLALDAALESYHQTNASDEALGALSQCYFEWASKLRDGERKPKLALRLELQILSAKLSLENRAAQARATQQQMRLSNEALGVLQQANRAAVTTMFLDPDWVAASQVDPVRAGPPRYRSVVPKVKPKLDAVADAVKRVNLGASSLKAARAGVVDPKAPITTAEFGADLAELFNGVGVGELIADPLAYKAFSEAASAVMGAVVQPVQCILAVKNAVQTQLDRRDIEQRRAAFSADLDANPARAFEALQDLLDREAAAKVVDLGKATASLAVLTVPGAGPFISTAIKAIVDVALQAKLLSIERHEMAEAQALIDSGHVDAGLFKASPLLGCYFLCLADTSVLLNWKPEEMLADGFTARIDALHALADPVIMRARRYIWESRFALAGTEGLKGLEWTASWEHHRLAYLSNLFSLPRFLQRVGRLLTPEERHPADASLDATAGLLSIELHEVPEDDDQAPAENPGKVEANLPGSEPTPAGPDGATPESAAPAPSSEADAALRDRLRQLDRQLTDASHTVDIAALVPDRLVVAEPPAPAPGAGGPWESRPGEPDLSVEVEGHRGGRPAQVDGRP